MKTSPLIIFICTLFLLNSPNNAQIDWDNASLGAVVQYTSASGDLKTYWGNIFAAGGIFQYRLKNNFSLEGMIAGSFLTPAGDSSGLPDILFINSAVSLRYSAGISRNLFFIISPGFSNTTMIFTGNAAEVLDDNFIEHELGVCLSSGIGFAITKGLRSEIFISAQNIFTAPENIALFSAGIKILWD